MLILADCMHHADGFTDFGLCTYLFFIFSFFFVNFLFCRLCSVELSNCQYGGARCPFYVWCI